MVLCAAGHAQRPVGSAMSPDLAMAAALLFTLFMWANGYV